MDLCIQIKKENRINLKTKIHVLKIYQNYFNWLVVAIFFFLSMPEDDFFFFLLTSFRDETITINIASFGVALWGSICHPLLTRQTKQ